MVDLIVKKDPNNTIPGRLAESKFVPANAKVSAASDFSHQLWQMEGLVTTPGSGTRSNYFDYGRVPGFPGGFALSLAEYAFARLYKPAHSHDRQGSWFTVLYELNALNIFVAFCSRNGYRGFNDVDRTIFLKFRHQIIYGANGNPPKSDDRAKDIIRIIYRLWEYRFSQTSPMREIPFGRPFDEVCKVSKTDYVNENRTPVIPDEIYGAITSIALDYVLTYSKPILQVWNELNARWEADTRVTPKEKISLRLNFFLRDILSQIESPWREKRWRRLSELYSELQQLRVACTIVILAFSGVRSSELLSIEEYCAVVDLNENGEKIHYLNTVVHKHRAGGKRDTWVIIQEVVDAVVVLEILTKHIRTVTGENRLVISDGTNAFFNIGKDFSTKSVTELTNHGLIAQIEKFAEYATKNLHAKIPLHAAEDGELEQWQFYPSQFRRTLARHIARQPFGTIAGMLQYKHVRATVFEGYAGSEPDWNKLLESEEVLASIDILEELAIDLSLGELAGGFSRELETDFYSEFKGRAEDFSPSQIAKWLNNKKKNLFVGKFNFCFFDASKALCTESPNATDPVLNFCQPENCHNACISKKHIPLWQAQKLQAENLLEYKGNSDFQNIILKNEVKKINEIVIKFIK